jgi:hypothetical protein
MAQQQSHRKLVGKARLSVKMMVARTVRLAMLAST